MNGSTAATAPSAQDYLIGLVLALVLTAIPFGLVYFKYLAGPAMFAVLAVTAIAQILVHLRYFLHLRLSQTPHETLLALGFAAILIFLMVGGSLWIMFDLHQRMAIPATH